MGNMTVNAKSRERSSDGRRTELIDAALRILARDGVAAATTRKIADEAGLPLGAVHYWFAGKDDLMEAVVIAVLEKLSDAMERAAEVSNSATLLDRRSPPRATRLEGNPGVWRCYWPLRHVPSRR
jgi:AcrR family transcriptional regulator